VEHREAESTVMHAQSLVPKQRGIVESGLVKAIKTMLSRHEDKMGSPDGSEGYERRILPHARSSECVRGVRLDGDSVLTSAWGFPGRRMLRVYGDSVLMSA
jgi:hypothetical protein